jgi:hypothetical protein
MSLPMDKEDEKSINWRNSGPFACSLLSRAFW